MSQDWGHRGPGAAGPFVQFTIRRAGLKKASVMTPAQRCPRRSLILAEAARQPRHERRPRREGHLRRAAWSAWFDRRPFESIRAQAIPGVVFPGTMPLVYTLLSA